MPSTWRITVARWRRLGMSGVGAFFGVSIAAFFMGGVSDVPFAPIAGAIIGAVFRGRLVWTVGRSMMLGMLAGIPLGMIVTGHSKGALPGSFWGTLFGLAVGICLEFGAGKKG